MSAGEIPHGRSMRGAYMADPAKPWHKLPTKHVRLRLQAADYSKTIDVRSVSDTMEGGWYAMENAIAEAFEDLPCRDRPADEHNPKAGTVSVAYIELTNAVGDRKIVEDTDLRREEWLKDFVVAAEIVNQST